DEQQAERPHWCGIGSRGRASGARSAPFLVCELTRFRRQGRGRGCRPPRAKSPPQRPGPPLAKSRGYHARRASGFDGHGQMILARTSKMLVTLLVPHRRGPVPPSTPGLAPSVGSAARSCVQVTGRHGVDSPRELAVSCPRAGVRDGASTERSVGMEFGIAVATGADSWKVAQRAEELGFTHVWFYDSQMLCADCFVAMGAGAVKTSRIRLGTGVLIPSNRIAPVAARAL